MTDLSTADDKRPKPPIDAKRQAPPGETEDMNVKPDHGEETYEGSGKLEGRVALITGGDSGIGRAVAIAYAREGADVVIAYLSEDEDAEDTAEWVRKTGRKALLIEGDIGEESHCRRLVDETIKAFGRLDILVNNAAFQRSYDKLEDVSSEEWERTYRTNIHAPFYLSKAAAPHMKKGASIINTTSIQGKKPSPNLLAYASTKGAITNFTAGLAQMLAEQGIRVNAVAPGPIWTPLIPSTLPMEKARNFGKDTPLKRPGQPAELAGAYVLLASDEASYITGAVIPVTGGLPMI